MSESQKKEEVVAGFVNPIDKLKDQFEKVFEDRARAEKNGHRGDIVPRAHSYEG